MKRPYVLYAATIALCVVGWLVVFSAGGRRLQPTSDAVHQAAYIAAGLGLMVGGTAFNYDVLRRLSPALYAVNLLLLLSVVLPGIGHSSHGAQRWINLGPLGTLQPSEPAKILIIITLSAYLARRALEYPDRVSDIRSLTMALLHVAIPFVVILKQPDLGSAMVVMAVTLVMLFVVGMPPVYLAGIMTAGLGLATLVIHEYQRNRLLIYLYPQSDPMGMGYSLIQSETAIGSGGWLGHGLFCGPMAQNGFIPEHHTDFAFAVLGEELGLVGTLGVLILFAILLGAILYAAWNARDAFGTLLCSGVAALVGFHVIVNIGMSIGLMPVTGLPLAFISYGGSAMLTDLAGLALVASVHARGGRRSIWLSD